MVILWALLLVLLIVFIQFFIFNKFVLKNVVYSRKIKQKAVFELESCQLVEKIENKKRLWIPWLYVESQLDIHLTFGKQENLFVSTGTLYQNHASFFMLRGYTRVTRTHRLTPVKRGVYYLTSVTLTAGDLLGFAKHVQHQKLEQIDPLIVYPQPLIPTVRLNSRDYSLGDVIVKRLILPDPFMRVGTREFVAGDAIKSINWYATARTDSLQVNQYDYTSNKRLMVLINCEDHADMWNTVTNVEQIEQYIRYTAGLTQLALSEGVEAGFATNMPTHRSNDITIALPQNGEAYWYTLLEILAQLKIERATPFPELMEHFLLYATEPIEFVVLSSYWNEKCEAIAEQLRYKQHQVYYVPLQEEEKVRDDIEIGKEHYDE